MIRHILCVVFNCTICVLHQNITREICRCKSGALLHCNILAGRCQNLAGDESKFLGRFIPQNRGGWVIFRVLTCRVCELPSSGVMLCRAGQFSGIMKSNSGARTVSMCCIRAATRGSQRRSRSKLAALILASSNAQATQYVRLNLASCGVVGYSFPPRLRRLRKFQV